MELFFGDDVDYIISGTLLFLDGKSILHWLINWRTAVHWLRSPHGRYRPSWISSQGRWSTRTEWLTVWFDSRSKTKNQRINQSTLALTDAEQHTIAMLPTMVGARKPWICLGKVRITSAIKISSVERGIGDNDDGMFQYQKVSPVYPKDVNK